MAGFFGDTFDDPQSAAIMALAAGMLRGDLGGGFLGANEAFGQARRAQALAQRDARDAQLHGLNLRKTQMELDAADRQRQDDAEMRRTMADVYSRRASGGAPAAPGALGSGSFGVVAEPPAAAPSAQPEGRSSMFTFYRQAGDALAAKGLVTAAQKYYDLSEKFRPKYNTTPQVLRGPDGKLVNVLVSEDGTTQTLPFGVKPAMKLQDLGGSVIAVDENEVTPGQKFGKTMTPDATASNAVAWANYRNAAERLSFDKNKEAQPQLVDGQWVYKPTMQNPRGTAQPVAGFNRKLDESARKQVSGIDALGGAVDEYLKTLDGFGSTDLLRPDRRAEMGTKYNNMMLQAKEAYNLGVLNGPDFDILQQVVTNPLTTKGAITSNEALGKQASELKRIMGNVRAAIAGQQAAQRPPVQPGSLGSGTFGLSASDIDAEIARRAGAR